MSDREKLLELALARLLRAVRARQNDPDNFDTLRELAAASGCAEATLARKP